MGERRRGCHPVGGEGEIRAAKVGEGVVDASCRVKGRNSRDRVVQTETGLNNLVKYHCYHTIGLYRDY